MWIHHPRPPPAPTVLLAALLPLLLAPAPASAEQVPGSATDIGRIPNANALLLDHRFFLKQIFEKYGHDGIMTFEGFEHLLESLGLARVAFDKRHGVALHRMANGTFREVHDALRLHMHDHAPSPPAAASAAPAAPSAPDAAAPDAPDAPSVSVQVADAEDDGNETRRTRTRRGLPAEEGLPPQENGARAAAEAPPRCLSPREMLVTFGLEANHGVAIDAARFLNLCPIIVYELDQRSCYLATEPAHKRSGPHPSAWAHASLSVAAASAVGLVAAAAAGQLLGRWRYVQPALDLLVAVGVGTLCGDALLHLLPHALTADDHGAPAQSGDAGSERSHPQEPVLRAAAAFGTIVALFALESLLHRLNARERGDKSQKEEEEGTWKSGMVVNGDGNCLRVATGGSGDGESTPEEGKMLSVTSTAPLPAGDHGHSHGGGAGGGGLGAVVWMVLLGDGVHNLTDGLAIGAAFCDDPVAGFATALAVFCHELPHEFGDFALLLKSGMSLRLALFYNVLSSVLSFVGMAVGVWVGNFDAAAQWIYAVTAGSFLYIALADLVPELSRNTSQSQTTTTACLHIFGLLLGGGIMLLIALYEDSLRALFE